MKFKLISPKFLALKEMKQNQTVFELNSQFKFCCYEPLRKISTGKFLDENKRWKLQSFEFKRNLESWKFETKARN